MNALSLFSILPTTPIAQAMQAIDQNGFGIVFLVDGTQMVATLTDGDIRRHILRGGDLNAPAQSIANPQFKCARSDQTPAEMELLLQKWSIYVLPVLDQYGQLVDVFSLQKKERLAKEALRLPVVIQAGGKGTRLYPYTKVLPKPLIPIGDLTITEHIINQFWGYGCQDFTMILGHKRNMIKAYFADENPDYHVHFVDELEPMGTGGGLSLLRGKIDGTFFMTNCDVLVFADYSDILHHHRSQKNMATVVCAQKSVTMPYGTLEVDGNGRLTAVQEKPSFSFLTNTGLYLLEPEFLNYVPDGKFIHMTDCLQACVDDGKPVGVYAISEDRWSDMGQPEEMEKMREKLGI